MYTNGIHELAYALGGGYWIDLLGSTRAPSFCGVDRNNALRNVTSHPLASSRCCCCSVGTSFFLQEEAPAARGTLHNYNFPPQRKDYPLF